MERLGTIADVPGTPEALVDLVASEAPGPGDLAPGRPWVTTNMVMSIDGAWATDGRSGGLSSEADHELFQAHRQLADVVLVGAGTVRAERYRRPRARDHAVEARRSRGQEDHPLLVVVSRGLDLPTDLPLLAGEPPEPVVVHPVGADPGSLPEGVRAEGCGTDGVDLAELLRRLHDRGARWLVCEGGPGLLGQLASAGLVDEYLVTLSPRLVGGDDVGLLAGRTPDPAVRAWGLHRVLRQGDHLMLSYRRASPS